MLALPAPGICGQVAVPREEGPTSASKFGPCEWQPHCSGQGIETWASFPPALLGAHRRDRWNYDPPQKAPRNRRLASCRKTLNNNICLQRGHVKWHLKECQELPCPHDWLEVPKVGTWGEGCDGGGRATQTIPSVCPTGAYNRADAKEILRHSV